MFCEKCHARTATVHMQQTVNGAYSERHFCEACARKEGGAVFDAFTQSPMDFFFDQSFRPMRQLVNQFAMSSRGGVAETLSDISPEREAQYVTFRQKISPFFARKGQKDKRGLQGEEKPMKEEVVSNEIKELQEKLRTLIIEERYEEAANVRDEMKKLKEKSNDEGGRKNGK